MKFEKYKQLLVKKYVLPNLYKVNNVYSNWSNLIEMKTTRSKSKAHASTYKKVVMLCGVPRTLQSRDCLVARVEYNKAYV